MKVFFHKLKIEACKRGKVKHSIRWMVRVSLGRIIITTNNDNRFFFDLHLIASWGLIVLPIGLIMFPYILILLLYS